METGVVISIGALFVSFVGLVLTSRKDTRQDAAANAVIQTKLNSVINGVDDIRVEMRAIQKAISDHGERLAKVEARSASNTHRIDALEGRKDAERND
jgi:cob(I)alamin adenosyltransferase